MADKTVTGSYGDTQLKDIGSGVYAPAEYSYAAQVTKLDPTNDGVTTYRSGCYITTISTIATTVVASFPIVVEEIRVLGGTLGAVAVYDNTAASGTNPIPSFTPTAGQVLIDKATTFSVGCTVTTAAATLATITWRPQ